MFIMINFGYKFRKIFTIDCLAAALFDCIWQTCWKELQEVYTNKQAQFQKQIISHQKKIETEQKRLQALLVKIKEEEENNPDNNKKDEKKGAKKGGKQPVVASSPLQQQKMDVEKSIQGSKNAVIKYNEKLIKIKDLVKKLQQIKEKIRKEQLYIELVDKLGERNFIKTKMKNNANEFLSDRGVYYLCTVKTQGEEEQVEPFVHQGFPVRTVEEDAAIVGEEPVFSLKKDDKAKKGGKKK